MGLLGATVQVVGFYVDKIRLFVSQLGFAKEVNHQFDPNFGTRTIN